MLRPHGQPGVAADRAAGLVQQRGRRLRRCASVDGGGQADAGGEVTMGKGTHCYS
ncbi:hypothetical protein [Duganella sp. S19_KUP01_CR8]|uniref:hypothetical protein n=1 Tax=Duganella sp. S19_KUP01_CR8 TaxID=3025502 RepID=UPI002FCDB07B